mgnify:CR=1 FL=1
MTPPIIPRGCISIYLYNNILTHINKLDKSINSGNIVIELNSMSLAQETPTTGVELVHQF